MGFFQGTQERVRNSHSKRAISVRATEVQQYLLNYFYNFGLGQRTLRKMIWTPIVHFVVMLKAI